MLKTITKITAIVSVLGASLVGNIQADTYVKGYFKSNGTYVMPHYRSSPNSVSYDNWSTKGNINPYTGKMGTKSLKTYSTYKGYKSSFKTSKYKIKW